VRHADQKKLPARAAAPAETARSTVAPTTAPAPAEAAAGAVPMLKMTFDFIAAAAAAATRAGGRNRVLISKHLPGPSTAKYAAETSI
jgi:hypothetical protein